MAAPVFPVEPGDYATLVRASEALEEARGVLGRYDCVPEAGQLGPAAHDAMATLDGARVQLEDIIRALGKAVPLLGAAADTLDRQLNREVESP
jgi:hypothetical protein